MSVGKFYFGLIFPLISAFYAQWMPPTDMTGEVCRNMEIQVQDIRGIAVMGAVVVPEETGMPVTTNADGVAIVPCSPSKGILPTVEVRANGFLPLRTQMFPDSHSRLSIILNDSEPVFENEHTITARELDVDVRKKSAQLQRDAAESLSANKYDEAEKLFSKALELTPSSVSIMNNLGVVALHQSNLDKAGKWFENAYESAPYNAEINGNLGLVRWMQHRRDESYALLTQALTFGYQSDWAYYILGIGALANGKNKESIRYLKKVHSARIPLRDLFLSFAWRNCGKLDKAKKSYFSFLMHNPAPFDQSGFENGK